jgi:hypothetical protein
MASLSHKKTEHCPFWSTTSRECRICKGGLFIPLDDHIEAYCNTSDYQHCLQYTMHPGNNLQDNDKANQATNRRKFARVEARLKITLVRYNHSGKIGSHCSGFAKTIDLSCGGMRLTTDKPLTNNSIVLFSFDSSSISILPECVGQVAWCNKAIDVPGYQAGITFQDDRIIEAMNLYLDGGQQSL